MYRGQKIDYIQTLTLTLNYEIKNHEMTKKERIC